MWYPASAGQVYRGGGGPAELHSPDLNHVPAPQGRTDRLKGALARAQTDAAMVHDIACRWYVARTPDARVWQGLGALAVEKDLNGCVWGLVERYQGPSESKGPAARGMGLLCGGTFMRGATTAGGYRSFAGRLTQSSRCRR